MWKHVVMFVDVERLQPADGRDAVDRVEEEPVMLRCGASVKETTTRARKRKSPVRTARRPRNVCKPR